MITAIEIENFKAIGKPTTFTMSNITLLFGPNSVGKSSVLHALHYLREILVNDNLDPEYSEISGQGVYLGGFERLVHKRDRDRTIKIKVTMSSPDSEDILSNLLYGPDITPFLREHNRNFLFVEDCEKLVKELLSHSDDNRRFFSKPEFSNHEKLGDIPVKQGVRQTSLAIEIAWDQKRNKPFVKVFTAYLNDVGVILFENDDYRQYAYLNTKILDFFPDKDWGFVHSAPTQTSESPTEHTWVDEVRRVCKRYKDIGKKPTRISSYEDYEFQLAHVYIDPQDSYWDESSIDEMTKRFEIDTSRIEVTDFTRQSLNTAFFYSSAVTETIRRSVMKEIEALLHVGPLRARFEQQENRTSSSTSWYDGQKAWDELLPEVHYDNSEGHQIVERISPDFISPWLRDNFGTGYSIVVQKLLSLDSRDIESLERSELSLNRSELWRNLTHNTKPQFRVFLEDVAGIRLNPSEVGTGISQIVPIIVAVYAGTTTIRVFEQPELHLHPKSQLAIADLLIFHKTKHWYPVIVETHSEHIVLRLLRRIRRTTSGEETDREKRVHPEDVAINYAQATPDGLQIKLLRVDSEGEFIDRWPGGFFEERGEELFQ